MSKVFITDYITNPDVEEKILPGLLTNKVLEKVEVLLVWHHEINSKYLKNFPNLKGIVRYGVGIDKINFDDVKKHKLVVCNTPDYAINEVSDTALALLLMITRGIKIYDQKSRLNLKTWTENTIISTIRRSSQQTLGIIGAGRIGSALIRKAIAIGFDVIFYDPYKIKESINGAKKIDNLKTLLRKSDIISIHTPLTNETKSLIDEKFIFNMKKGASIINTARGGIVKNLDILYEALKTNKINCVGFDVLPKEPPDECKFIKLWKSNDPISSRIIINPHTSFYSVDSYEESRVKTALNAKRIIEGETPTNIIEDYRNE